MGKHLNPFLTSLIILLMILPDSFGQKIKVTSDLRLVTELDVEKSIGKDWKIGVGVKSWLEKDISELGEIDLDATIGYQPFKFISTDVGYRWSKKRNKEDDFIAHNRFNLSLDFIAKIERLKIDYRIGYQNIDDENLWEIENNPAKNILRNRIQIRYNIRKSRFTPFIFTEHYGLLYSGDDYGIKIKLEIGTNYTLKKHHELKIYYRVDKELNNDNPFTFYSLGIGYKFQF
jgi:hypothetical protein